MIGAGLALGAVALGDAIAGGLACERRSIQRSVAGILVALVTFLVGAMLLRLETQELGWLLVLVALYSTSWVGLRQVETTTVMQAWLSVLANGIFVAWILASRPPSMGPGSPMEGWLRGLPYPGMRGVSPSAAVLGLGVALWLGPTANGIVRAVLVAAGADPGTSEQSLRGGRIIGVLERWMIFGFMLAGAPTAAAIIVSAKSILRFPELSEKAKPAPAGGSEPALNVVTEYLLLGSLVSWSLALAPAVLFR